jgi:hypothetical protein
VHPHASRRSFRGSLMKAWITENIIDAFFDVDPFWHFIAIAIGLLAGAILFGG